MADDYFTYDFGSNSGYDYGSLYDDYSLSGPSEAYTDLDTGYSLGDYDFSFDPSVLPENAYMDGLGNVVFNDGSYITTDGNLYSADGKTVDSTSPIWGAAQNVVKGIDWSKLLYSGSQALGGYLGANQQANAAQDALEFTKAQNAANQAMMAPYVGTGVNALNNLTQMSAQPTPTFNYDPSTFYESPVFQNLYAAGVAPVIAEASKVGMYGSGNMASALMDRGQQIAAQYMPVDQSIQQQNYLNYLNANQQDYTRQAGLASVGLEAAGRSTSLGANAAQQGAGYISQLGDAQGQMWQAPVNAMGSYFAPQPKNQYTLSYGG